MKFSDFTLAKLIIGTPVALATDVPTLTLAIACTLLALITKDWRIGICVYCFVIWLVQSRIVGR